MISATCNFLFAENRVGVEGNVVLDDADGVGGRGGTPGDHGGDGVSDVKDFVFGTFADAVG